VRVTCVMTLRGSLRTTLKVITSYLDLQPYSRLHHRCRHTDYILLSLWALCTYHVSSTKNFQHILSEMLALTTLGKEICNFNVYISITLIYIYIYICIYTYIYASTYHEILLKYKKEQHQISRKIPLRLHRSLVA
jgi:hypothetical protein